MKILVLQLARLGDILMTWPVLNGLRRQYPQAQIDILVRSRFASALDGLNAVDNIRLLPTEAILNPLIQEQADISASTNQLEEFIDSLRDENYTKIINFTYSNLSSWLVAEIAHESTDIVGYSRHADETLKICDDMSAYFYAQVGIEGANRVHVADIMAASAGVDFVEEDWNGPKDLASSISLPSEFIVLHIGASNLKKTLSAETWAHAIRALKNMGTPQKIVLIGGEAEKEIGQKIEELSHSKDIINLAGLTTLQDLHSIIARAQLLVGADSAPIHIASLSDTPTLNISLDMVNFWETGPKSSLSFIYKKSGEMINGFKLGQIIYDLLTGVLDEELIVRGPGITSYVAEGSPLQEFQWQMVKALYMGEKFPIAERMEIIEAAEKLKEVNELAIQQLNLAPVIGVPAIAPFLNTVDEVINNISRIVPELSPMVSWYNAEKVRIVPGSLEDLIAATLGVHQAFINHLRVYIPQEHIAEEVINGEI